MSEVVRLEGLSKRYRQLTALDNVSVTIHRGDIVGLIGKNGAGKSTLLRLITGLSTPTAGDIVLFGKKGAVNLVAGRKLLGTLVEMPAFYPHLSGRKNLMYYAIQRSVPQRTQKVAELLELVGLTAAAERAFKDYSLGMKQRLGIAACLLHQPEVIILDEPNNGLDPDGIVEIRELLLRLNREQHITMIISSHILGELEHLATRYILVDKGRVRDVIDAQSLHHQTKGVFRLVTSNNQKAAELLQNSLHVTVQSEGDALLVHEVSNAAQVTRTIFENGLDVLEATPQRPSLEGYFLSTLKGDVHHDSLLEK